ncbi:MAG TPA: type IV pili twitching motility protein PilT, partial [Caldithrix sp.]|nr:type IV pili twitching motility protein PilT [Caldithrix sp.]
HTHSFESALRHCLREDPDVILVGEMRDIQTITLALHAAETGHLVLSTLHTNTASDSVDRIVDVFPAERQQQIRVMLANTLVGILAQRLVPMAFKNDRVALLEILVVNAAVQNLIREGKSYQIPTAIQTGADIGMQTFARSFDKLQKNNLISPTLKLSDFV